MTTIRSPLHLQVGDKADFSITTRFVDHEVVRAYENDGVKMLELRSPTGNVRCFPAIRLHDVECERDG